MSVISEVIAHKLVIQLMYSCDRGIFVFATISQTTCFFKLHEKNITSYAQISKLNWTLRPVTKTT